MIRTKILNGHVGEHMVVCTHSNGNWEGQYLNQSKKGYL